jgi:hypothetical protein
VISSGVVIVGSSVCGSGVVGTSVTIVGVGSGVRGYGGGVDDI